MNTQPEAAVETHWGRATGWCRQVKEELSIGLVDVVVVALETVAHRLDGQARVGLSVIETMGWVPGMERSGVEPSPSMFHGITNERKW